MCAATGRAPEPDPRPTQASMAAAQTPLQPAQASRRAYALLFAALLLAVIAARVRLLGVPLERDEGEFAYQGLLLLKGHAPFDGLYTMKLPGVGLLYALLILVFGRSAQAIHLGLLLCNLVCVGLVWRLGRRLLGAETGLAAAAAYALLSVSQGVLGVFAHATQFVVLFSLAALLLLLRLRDGEGGLRTAAAAGFCFGLAVLMKQHAALLADFGLVAAAAFGARTRRALATAAAFAGGSAIPVLAVAAWCAAAGTGPRAWLWCVEYARRYVSLIGPREGIARFLAYTPQVAAFEAPLWVAAGVGLVLLAARRARPTARPFLLGLLVASLAALSPGFYFRAHYFVLLLPVVALLAAFAVTETGVLVSSRAPDSRLSRALAPTLLGLLLTWGLVRETGYLFVVPPTEVSRQIYWPNPFPESALVAEYLRTHSGPDDEIAVLGSEPEIFFYADRRSATGYIYMYGLMEPQPFAASMQADMMREIEAAKPLFLVLVNMETSWGVRRDSIQDVLHWAPDYAARHYQLEGLVEVRLDGSRAYWGRDAAREPQSAHYITVWRRDANASPHPAPAPHVGDRGRS